MTSDDKYFDTEEYFSTPVQYDLQQAIHSMCCVPYVQNSCYSSVTLGARSVHQSPRQYYTTVCCYWVTGTARSPGMVRIYSQSISQSVCCCSSSSYNFQIQEGVSKKSHKKTMVLASNTTWISKLQDLLRPKIYTLYSFSKLYAFCIVFLQNSEETFVSKHGSKYEINIGSIYLIYGKKDKGEYFVYLADRFSQVKHICREFHSVVHVIMQCCRHHPPIFYKDEVLSATVICEDNVKLETQCTKQQIHRTNFYISSPKLVKHFGTSRMIIMLATLEDSTYAT